MRKLLSLCLILFISLRTFAQVSVSVLVQPPYSAYTEDYLLRSNQVLITLSNASRVPQAVKLIASLEGSNGVKAYIRPTYVPLYPIVLQANQTRTFNYATLRATFANLTADDIISEGFNTDGVAQRGRLPEGTYSLCVQVLGYSNGQPLGANGCTNFNLVEYDAPMIIQPFDDSEVTVLKPQNLLFSWTSAGMAVKTRYRLQMIDLTASGKNNPNDAFQSGFLFFDKQNLVTPNYAYSPIDPSLKAGHQYAVRVTAYDPNKKLAYKNNGISAVSVFTAKENLLVLKPKDDKETEGKVNKPDFDITANAPTGKLFDDPALGPCLSETALLKAPLAGNQNGFANGTHVKVGKFVMKNTVFTKKTGSYEGTGTIKINFLGVNLLCKFSGIKINTNQEMTAGKVTGQVTNNSILTDEIATVKEGALEEIPELEQYLDLLKQNTRKVSQLKKGAFPSSDLPLNLDNANGNIGIVGVIFEPTQAYINAAATLEIPQAFEAAGLSIGSKGMAIQPNGFGLSGVQIKLTKDRSLSISDALSLTIRGTGNKQSYLSFDCAGLKDVGLYGSMAFSRNAVVPLNDANQVIADANTKVSADFQLIGQNKKINSFLVGGTMSHKFALAVAQDLIFDCANENIVIDFSATENTQNPAFKSKFPKKTNDWMGVYIPKFAVALPNYFKKQSGKNAPTALTVGATDIVYDVAGLNGLVFVESALGDITKSNAQDNGKGKIVNWGIKISKIDIDLKNSQLNGGGLHGKVQLPFGEDTDVGFDATASMSDDNKIGFGFKITTTKDIEAKMFFAKLKLTPNSSISIERDKKDQVMTISALLNGSLGIELGKDKAPENANVSRFSMPQLDFQQLSIASRDVEGNIPALDMAFAQLNGNIQAKIGDAFNLQLKNIGFEKQGNDGVGLKIGLAVSLFGSDANGKGVAGGTDLTIFAKHNGTFFAYEKTNLNGIVIDANFGVAQLKGSLQIFNNDAKFGNGFKGAIAAKITGLNCGFEVNLQVGRTLPKSGDYPYWFFQASVFFPDPGLPIPGTLLSLNKVMGGAWYNMKGGSEIDANTNGLDYGSAGEAGKAMKTKLEPSNKGNDVCGFKVGVGLGLAGKKNALNGELTFTMAFNQDWKVSKLNLHGIMHVMKGPNRTDDGIVVIKGEADITLDIVNRSFKAKAGMDMTLAKFVTGGGNFDMYFELPKVQNGVAIEDGKVKWYLKVGSFDPKLDPFHDNNRLHAEVAFDYAALNVGIKVQGYVMAGNYQMPTQLPPLPKAIRDMIGGDPKMAVLPASVRGDQPGFGFALGAGVSLDAVVGFEGVLSLDVHALAGFDLLVNQLNGTCDFNGDGKAEDIGWHGWYAQGQLYAMATADVKLLGQSILGAGIGATLQFKGPNPTWVKGDLVVYGKIGKTTKTWHGSLERGKLCKDMKTQLDPFQDAILVRSIGTNKGSNTDVSPTNGTMWVVLGMPFNAQPVDKKGNTVYFAGEEGTITPGDGIYGYQFKFNIKLIDKTNNKSVPFDVLSVKDQLLTIRPDDWLVGNRTYQIIINAEIDTDKKYAVKENPTYDFITAAAPSKFTTGDLLSSYPAINQRFFMKKSLTNSGPARGMLELRHDMSYLFTDSTKVVAVIRAVNGSTPFPWTASCSYKDHVIQFTIPADLKNSTIYELSLELFDSKFVPKPNQPAKSKVIFEGLHFGTSKYNSMMEKLAATSVKKTAYLPYNTTASWMFAGGSNTLKSSFQVPVMLLEVGENFDAYELNYYKVADKDGDTEINGFPISVDETVQLTAFYWMFETRKKYVEFEGLSNNDQDLLSSLTDKGLIPFPSGEPFNGKTRPPYTAESPKFVKQNYEFMEQKLRNANQLEANAHLLEVAQPLSAQDIENAKNEKSNQQWGNKKGNNGVSYTALIDWNIYDAQYSTAYRAREMMTNAAQKGATIYLKTKQLVEQLSFPQYTNKTLLYNVSGSEPSSNFSGISHTQVLKLWKYTYSPPIGLDKVIDK